LPKRRRNETSKRAKRVLSVVGDAGKIRGKLEASRNQLKRYGGVVKWYAARGEMRQAKCPLHQRLGSLSRNILMCLAKLFKLWKPVSGDPCLRGNQW